MLDSENQRNRNCHRSSQIRWQLPVSHWEKERTAELTWMLLSTASRKFGRVVGFSRYSLNATSTSCIVTRNSSCVSRVCSDSSLRVCAICRLILTWQTDIRDCQGTGNKVVQEKLIYMTRSYACVNPPVKVVDSFTDVVLAKQALYSVQHGPPINSVSNYQQSAI